MEHESLNTHSVSKTEIKNNVDSILNRESDVVWREEDGLQASGEFDKISASTSEKSEMDIMGDMFYGLGDFE